MRLISKAKIILPCIFLFFTLNTWAQDNFYDIGTIQQIEIHFTQSNWDYILDTMKAGSGKYLMAQWVKINGTQFDSVGVKYKGSSSYDPLFAKNPLHLSLDEFKDQSYQGIASIKLSNFYGDPSMIREPLAYSILANYMDCSASNFADVTINGSLSGLYSNDESVNKKFCSAHFYSSGNTFIKCSPVQPGPGSKSNLKYISADSSAYFDKYELESDNGWNDLVGLCDVVTNQPSALSSVLDIDRALWMLAFNNVMVTLDSYSGWYSQNHYLYKDNTGHFNEIAWDLNLSFGGFPFAGTQNGGSGGLTVDEMKQMDPLLHDSQNDWPLIFNLLNNATWKRMYIAHMRTIITENFSNGNYIAIAQMMQDLVDASVQADQTKFFTYAQFQQGLTGDVTFNSFVVPGIQNLMDARAVNLLSSDIFSDVPPVIFNVVPDNDNPTIDDVVTVTAHATGQGQLGVYLGLRMDKADKFVRQPMYDDGNHNDGAAGDGIYGASFTMTSQTAQYYIYAEVDETGVFAATFSPARAEHEFYNLTALIPTATPGDVVINEFVAKNNSGTVNEFGNHEDWIELVSLTDEPVNLYGLYLTDDYNNPVKYAFPENTIMQPKGYLIIWADEEDTVSAFLHANFKLAATGEMLMLSDGAGTVLDSLTFGSQQADISLGRCPDGTGTFNELSIPTFGFTNYCPAGISEPGSAVQQIVLAPNPCKDHICLVTKYYQDLEFLIMNSSGMVVLHENIQSSSKTIDVQNFAPGIYFYMIKEENGRFISSGKLLKQ